MTIQRITISVPEGVAIRLKKAAGKTPVSSWLTDLIEGHLDDADLEAKFLEFYGDVRPSSADVRAADAMFNRLTQASRKRKTA